MNEFSLLEKKIITHIASVKNVEDTSLAALISENIKAIAIEWNNEEPFFRICYFEKSNIRPEEYVDKLYEIIFLLKYLEDNRYIYIHSNKNLIEDNSLYNHNDYIRRGEMNYWMNKGDREDFVHIKTCEIRTNFGESINYYANSLFYPSNALKELIKNKFKTLERVKFEKQQQTAWGGIIIALIVGLFGLIVSLYSLYQPTKIDAEQVKILESGMDSIKCIINSKTHPSPMKVEIDSSQIEVLKKELSGIENIIKQHRIPKIINSRIINDTINVKGVVGNN